MLLLIQYRMMMRLMATTLMIPSMLLPLRPDRLLIGSHSIYNGAMHESCPDERNSA
jgi:hypothetical protein